MSTGRHKSHRADSVGCLEAAVLAAILFISVPVSLPAEEPLGVQPLISLALDESHRVLPLDTHALIEPHEIEQFLSFLERTPPDWAAVYGRGHYDPQLDERLFRLNRERDAKREGSDVLHWRIGFVWSGELSTIDQESGGFPVALGPRFTKTSWGVVRFKYEDLDGSLVAMPTAAQRTHLQAKIQQGHSVEIDVVMVGRLVPEESIVYDFSHEQEGLGLIMPVVRVDALFYLIPP